MRKLAAAIGCVAALTMPTPAHAADATIDISPARAEIGGTVVLTAVCPTGTRITQLTATGVFTTLIAPSTESSYSETVTIGTEIVPGSYTVNLTCAADYFDVPRTESATLKVTTAPKSQAVSQAPTPEAPRIAPAAPAVEQVKAPRSGPRPAVTQARANNNNVSWLAATVALVIAAASLAGFVGGRLRRMAD